MKELLIGMLMLIMVAGCSITDTSRQYYILDNKCDSVVMDVIKGDEENSSALDVSPTTDLDVSATGL